MSNRKNGSMHFLTKVMLLIVLAVLLLEVVVPQISFLRTNGETQVVLFASYAEFQQQKPIPTFADVEPIFQERCIICHNGPGAPKKLQLTSYELILKGSENGPVVKPGNPIDSELIKRLKGISLPRMPLTGPPYLSEEEIKLIEKWIAQGAKDAMWVSAPIPEGARVRLHGRLSAPWQLDSLRLQPAEHVRIKKSPRVGDYVRVRGIVKNHGSILVERIRK